MVTMSRPSPDMSPASAARRSASFIEDATQVASVPVSSGRSVPARPPPEPAGTGRPSSSWRNESGPRFETTTSPDMSGNLQGAGPGVVGDRPARSVGDADPGPGQGG